MESNRRRGRLGLLFHLQSQALPLIRCSARTTVRHPVWKSMSSHFSPSASPPATNYVASKARMWHYEFMDATLVLGQQGRIVIPAEVRAALGLAPGDHLHLHLQASRHGPPQVCVTVGGMSARLSSMPGSHFVARPPSR